ncbi:unnamed protein product [Ceutorhynchus assimilis]|uniref:Superoxide dismutase [Cu-Zn] n=1 Tax=Ceutorhynchus assimilis TaxID=467358 RepID=A0A9P0DC18_9CUCU|nr:unnamed protein product [Ceutorhynchus assimilis]
MFKYFVVLAFVAVASAEHPSSVHHYLASTARKAAVRISPDGAFKASGTVYFTEVAGGIQITGNLTGLEPGLHGFHVHAIGDITRGCASAGPHFNPQNVTHGGRNASVRHVGDLGNVEADVNGIAIFEFVDSVISLDGTNNIIGRAVVVHQDADDLGLGDKSDSLTTGHAGARLGCGVIGTL